MYSVRITKMKSNDECLVIDRANAKICFLRNNENVNIKIYSNKRLKENQLFSGKIYVDRDYVNSFVTTSPKVNISMFIDECSIKNNTSKLISIKLKKIQKTGEIKTKEKVDDILDMPFFDTTDVIEPIKKIETEDYEKKHKEEKKKLCKYYSEQDSKSKTFKLLDCVVIDDNTITFHEPSNDHGTIDVYLTHISKVDNYIV